ncbi:MAG: adenylate/guanylate cyclase domain-containing protein [Burkholderiales bacterium]
MTKEAASDTRSEGPPADGARAGLYAPRILQHHLATDPGGRWWVHEGTAVFTDVSGFTKLSEQLARKGREGSEQITEVIGRCFESILAVAYDNGASLLKFGGDALLLWFQDAGHATRACRASVLMRRILRDVGRIDVPGAKVTLRMSQGVHSGEFHFFMAGETHHELVVTGPGWSRVVTMEHEADAGEILVSTETAALLPARCLGDSKGPGILLQRAPDGNDKLPLVPRPTVAHETLARCLAPAVRAHVLGGGGAPEHRPVTVAFIKFEGIDSLIATQGSAATADLLHRLVATVEAATEAQGIALLASDIDVDGGKLILTAGAPVVTGEDEERMLLALRAIVDAHVPVQIRIGVNRGAIFAGDIGPFYRRTYTVMGDVVNLAARLMAKAPVGRIYATADVLDRSNTLFGTTALAPFMVKGKSKPIAAWDVGDAMGSRTRQSTLEVLPLTGRDAEIATLREALSEARAGKGHAFEIVGEAGVGKSRLVNAVRDEAGDFTRLHAVCEAYTASKPYAVWQELLRELNGIARDMPEDAVAERLRSIVAERTPALMPWLPLIAIAFGVEVPSTPDVDMLAENHRRPKLHESVLAFLGALLPGPSLIALEDSHHMDVASSELLAYIAPQAATRPWVVVVARRPAAKASSAAAGVTRIELAPLAPADALRLVKMAAEKHPLPPHVLDVVAERSGGNPQFLRDLMRVAIDTGGVTALPDSAEAATMARIDALTPDDRTILRRAAVLGLTFHPRMLAWLDQGEASRIADASAWQRLREFFDEEDDGYLRFRRSLLRDAAYQGLPFKLRREYHGAAARNIASESGASEEMAGILSLHHFEAREFEPAWRQARIAAKRAGEVYAYVEAAELYSRSLEASRHVPRIAPEELASVQESLGDMLTRAGDFPRAIAAYDAARRLSSDRPLSTAELLIKRSRLEEKLGKYPQALRWAARARKVLADGTGSAIARQLARVDSWYATVLQAEGRNVDALQWAQQAIAAAESVDDPEALGAGCCVVALAKAALGQTDWEPFAERSLRAYERSGDRVKQAVILNNVGVVYQAEGRWDRAMDYYRRGGDASSKIGDRFTAALSSMNVAEILADRGEVTEADALLKEALPLWRSSKYRFFHGACLSLLGRVAMRDGRLDEASMRLQEAKSNFAHVGASQEAAAMDARLAECRLYAGDARGALELADATLSTAAAGEGVSAILPLLERVRGEALLRIGDDRAAHAAFTKGLETARARNDLYETLLLLIALIRVAERLGIPAPDGATEESERLFDSLHIRAIAELPPVPAA